MGSFLSYNQSKNVEENFMNRIRKMKTKLNLWLSRDLTLYGKSLGVSQLIYTASMLTVPTSVIKNVQAELFNFLWKNQKDKIKRLVMYQPLAEGGLNFVNFPAVVKSLRLAWISRFLSNSRDSWKAIPNHYLSTHGGLQCLLKGNYNADDINNNLPTFYRELLLYFREFKNKYERNILIWQLPALE